MAIFFYSTGLRRFARNDVKVLLLFKGHCPPANKNVRLILISKTKNPFASRKKGFLYGIKLE